ncbi:MYND-type domain-containing protein [Mycena chlorophos]|uniref:MYND-type domain-containing protein n=1 Tax=Mycena chlorophos TaxID=658473 RepID=A0A8H6VS33_MYCCL|nr:MYND-type domain-containing protein [Mycena chlorophos]
MHPLLEPVRTRFLPGRLKLHAKALIAGSANEDDLRALVRYIDQRSTTSTDAEYTLPAFYAVLDPSYLPQDPSEIDGLQPTRMRTAYQAFTILGAKPDILFTDGLARAFWPRVLQWAIFFCTYGVAIPGVQHIPDFDADVFVPATSIFTKLLLSCDDPTELLPGIDEPDAVFICARGWSLLAPAPEDYPVLLRFVCVLFPRCELDIYRDRLASLLEGTYGYDGLAKLLLQGMHFLLKQARRSRQPLEALNDLMELVRFIQDVDPMLSLRKGPLLRVDIANRPPSRLTVALIDHDAVYMLAHSAYTLLVDSPEGVEPVGYTLLALLSRLVTHPSGHDRAQRTGQYLVRAVLKFASLDIPNVNHLAAHSQELLAFYCTSILPTLLVSGRFLAGLQAVLGTERLPKAPNTLWASGAAPELSDGPSVFALLQDSGFQAWSLVQGFWHPLYTTMSANLSSAQRLFAGLEHPVFRWGRNCSNLNCPRAASDDAKKCGGCSMLCYCSVACQKIDWRTGGHRKLCSAYRLLHQHHRRISLSRTQQDLLLNSAFASSHFFFPANADSITHIDFTELGKPRTTIDTIKAPGSDSGREISEVMRCEGELPPGADLVWSDLIRRGYASGGNLKLVAIHFARGVPAYGGKRETLVALVLKNPLKYQT